MRPGPKIDAEDPNLWNLRTEALNRRLAWGAAHWHVRKILRWCIRSWMSTHLTDMNLSVDDRALMAAARRGDRGALRTLAVTLDERLGDDDACLDGAVMAWQAVHGGRRRSGATMDAVAKHLISLHRRLVGARVAHASGLQVVPA